MPGARGFSLLELAIVLAMVALLAGSLLGALSGQRDDARRREAQKQLDEIRETLLGFAASHGRLPCPAAPALDHLAAGAGQEDCSLEHGVLPWASLALPESDPWGQRFTYFASRKFTASLAPSALASFTLDTGIAPDNADTANIRDSATAGVDAASDLPAVIVCHGSHPAGGWRPDGSHIGGALGDEAENADADLLFVSHPPSPDFDDQLVWLPASLLKARLLAAGRLP